MSTREGVRLCCVCDQPITGKAERVEQFSASGARPDKYRHPDCHPAMRSH